MLAQSWGLFIYEFANVCHVTLQIYSNRIIPSLKVKMKHTQKSWSSRGIALIWGHAIGVLNIRGMIRCDGTCSRKKLKRILVVPTLSHRDDIVVVKQHRSTIGPSVARRGHQTTVAAPKVAPHGKRETWQVLENQNAEFHAQCGKLYKTS